MIIVGAFMESRQIGRLADLELVEGLVEIIERGGGNAVGTEAQIGVVEIEFENFILIEGPFKPKGKNRLANLALVTERTADQKILGDLLRNCRATDRTLAVEGVSRVGKGGAQNTDKIDPIVSVEILGKLDNLDMLVNNAGFNSRRTIKPKSITSKPKELEQDIKGWEEEIKTNLTGTYLCSYLAADFMSRNNLGNNFLFFSIQRQQ